MTRETSRRVHLRDLLSQFFHSAAPPKRVERLRKVLRDHPGRLASLTLLRLQELLQRALGGGSAIEQNKLPAVARA